MSVITVKEAHERGNIDTVLGRMAYLFEHDLRTNYKRGSYLSHHPEVSIPLCSSFYWELKKPGVFIRQETYVIYGVPRKDVNRKEPIIIHGFYNLDELRDFAEKWNIDVKDEKPVIEDWNNENKKEIISEIKVNTQVEKTYDPIDDLIDALTK